MEISVVLVIITFIISMVIVSSSLIQQATLRAVIVEQSHHIKAIFLFKNKYGGLPGDWPFASEVWGSECNGPSPLYCNGNGDNIIENTPSSTYQDESLRAWELLGLAGMINNQYTGMGPFSGVYYGPSSGRQGIVPEAPMGGNWMISWNGAYQQNDSSLSGQGLGFGIGGNNILSSNDAYTIDLKIDDGDPRTGLVMAYSYMSSKCYVGSGGTFTYTTQYSGINCALFFVFNPSVQ